MQEKIEVSVCCTVYNHERYIRKCLDSLLNQETDFAYEVLAHDDCSTDGSLAILQEYKERYGEKLRLLTEEENQYSKGRHIFGELVFPRARGRYIAICEGDDFWCDPHKLQKQYDAMQNSDAVWCTHFVQCVYETGEIAEGRLIPGKFGRDLQSPACFDTAEMLEMYISDGFQLTSFFARRSIIQDYCTNLPEFVRISPTGDEALVRYAASQGKTLFLPEILSCYRMGAMDSWTTLAMQSNRKMAEQFAGLQRMLRAFDSYTGHRYSEIIARDLVGKEWKELQYRGDYHRMLEKKFSEYRKGWSLAAKLKLVVKAVCFGNGHLAPRDTKD